MMAAGVLSSASYLTYLNDYISIILKGTDQSLIEQLNEPYLDEIEGHARSILMQWHHDQAIDQQSALFVENVGYLNRKIARLSERHRLHQKQLERIEQLVCNAETVQLVTLILESLAESNRRHADRFHRHFSVLIDSFALLKSCKTIFSPVSQRLIESEYYEQYLTEVLSSEIQAIQLFFIGAVSRLASLRPDTTRHQLYSRFLTKFYIPQQFPNNIDLHYCTLGILSQMDPSLLMQDHPCIATLVSLFIHISSTHAEENIKVLIFPIFQLFNALCIQSKTAACYLNTDQLVDVLLHYVTHRRDYRTQIYACLLLGHIIGEDQLVRLRINYKLTMKLLDLFSDYTQETENILASLLSLTIHEQIQFIIAHTYQLNTFMRLSEQYPIVHEIIWKLSFHADIIEQLSERHEEFVKQLSSLTSSVAAQGILHNIEMKKASRLPVTNNFAFDFTIVSSPRDDQLVRSIEDHLLKHHLRAGPASDARCILLCLTEETKHDCSAQAAVRQALFDGKKVFLCITQKTYRVDDWFGVLHTPERRPLNIIASGVEKVLGEVQRECRHDLHLPTISKRTRIVTPPRQSSQTTFTLSPLPPPQASPVEASSKAPGKKIQTWTNREVLAWCENNKLNGFNKILTLYDGRSLLALAHISRMNAPHTIINHLRNDCRKQGLRITFVEFVRFQTALDELLRLERTMLRRQSVSTLASRYVYRGRAKQET